MIEVAHTAEFERVAALPRRTLDAATAAEWAAFLTPLYALRPGVELRPWQALALAECVDCGGAFLALPVGQGKALAHGERVPTPSGWKSIESLREGDQVYGRDGWPTRITGVYPQGERDAYRVTFSDGRGVTCDASHLWTFRTSGGGTGPSEYWHTRTAAEWAREPLSRKCGAHRAHRVFAPMTAPVIRGEAKLPIDPYVLGALLGDGGLTQATYNFTSADEAITADVAQELARIGLELHAASRQNSGKATQYNVARARGTCFCGKPRIARGLCERHYRQSDRSEAYDATPLRTIMRSLGLHGRSSHDKFVPPAYVNASIAQRLDLLRGLLDTDGAVSGRGSAEYATASFAMLADVRDIVESLGGTCTTGSRVIRGVTHYRGRVKLPLDMCPFRLARKADAYLAGAAKAQRGPYRAVVSITPVPRTACTCISVEAPDGHFLCEGYVVTHNTLISWLLPTAMRAERTLLLVPGALVKKTEADFASFVGVWREPQHAHVIATREKLATVAGKDLLAAYAPDLIVIDEADDLANARSSAASRIDRYVRDHDVRVVAMTGTPSRKSIMGYWHLLAWTLGDGAPIPLVRDEAQLWALAIDAHRGQRPAPGPLGSTLRAARAWYRARLIATPGVVVVDEDSCDAPLTVRVRIARDDAQLSAAFERFAVEQETPGGIPVSDPLSRWLLDAQLGLGLYSRWNPAPPDEWRNARRAVARFVRERIDASRRGSRPLDTEAQVLRAHVTNPVVVEWARLKPTFAGTTETVWISRSTLDDVHAWLREVDAPGIVWCGSVDFGRALAAEAKLAYYGPGGRTDAGDALHDAPEGVPLVASWNANKKGFNLQAWTRQLLVMPPQSAKWYEQIFGRSHRSGQREHVIVDVLATSGGTLDALDAAIEEAACVRDREALTQKLLRADIVRAEPRITPANEFRWARKAE